MKSTKVFVWKLEQKIKNYRRILKNISRKSKEKITKDFIKIPKEKTYKEKTAGTFTSCFAFILQESFPNFL